MQKDSGRRELLDEIEDLRGRLQEAEDTLNAIRSGQVDALVMCGSKGERVFTLKGAEQPYRILVEAINEGAVTLLPDHTVVYSNACFSRMIQTPLERIIGASFDLFVDPENLPALDAALAAALHSGAKLEVNLLAGMWGKIPAELSICPMSFENTVGAGIIVNDVSERKRSEEEAARRRAEDLERLAELERFRRLTVGRELRMIELKKELAALKGLAGHAEPEREPAK